MLCRRDRRHGKPGGLLHAGAARLGERERWVRGAKAGWKAGRHTWECLIHNWRLALLLRTVGTQWECKPGDLRS